jgi:hypothetical protein
MELVRHYQERQQIRGFTFHFQMPPYLLVVFSLLVGFAVVSLGVWALGQSAVPLPNPFAAFADVFPGQPRSAAQMRGFLCLTSAYGSEPNEYCSVDLARGIVSQIDVYIAEDLIDEISFRLREDTLRVGDLMLIWGTPEIRENGHSVYFYWRSMGVTAMVTEYFGRFSHFLPVRRVIIGKVEV